MPWSRVLDDAPGTSPSSIPTHYPPCHTNHSYWVGRSPRALSVHSHLSPGSARETLPARCWPSACHQERIHSPMYTRHPLLPRVQHIPTAPRSAALSLPMPHTPGHLHRQHAPPDGSAALSVNSLALQGFANWLLARISTSCQDYVDQRDEEAAEKRLSRVPAVQVTLRDTPEGLNGALPPSHSRSLRQTAETGRWSP